MRLLTTYTKGEWTDLSPDDGEEGANYSDQLRQSLTEFLRSPNLIVLTGLGTSLCIKDNSGKKLAPTMGDLWDAIETKVTPRVFAEICNRVRHRKETDPDSGEECFVADIELLLSKCLIFNQYKPSPEIRKFIKQAEAVIVDLCDFLDDSATLAVHEAFLRRIGRRPTRHPRTKLFTTNYDAAFETAASRIHFTVVDGFSHTMPQEFDSGYFAYDLVRRDDDGSAPNFIPNVFHLYKLHGSIDWKQDDERIIKQVSPEKPVLIYPRHSKFELSYESPFLDLMSRFQGSLRQTETSLLVIGFGFNDKHLTQPILSAIRSNVGLRTIVVSPSLEGSENDAVALIESLISAGDSRLGLVAATFEEFVPFLPDLVSETEEEKHRKRLKGRA